MAAAECGTVGFSGGHDLIRFIGKFTCAEKGCRPPERSLAFASAAQLPPKFEDVTAAEHRTKPVVEERRRKTKGGRENKRGRFKRSEQKRQA